jgi:putative oxidoreductase
VKVPFLLGRLLFGGYFLYIGIHHFQEYESMKQYAGSKHVPKPGLAVKATGAALIVGGASILLGVKPKVGTLSVLGFLAAVSPIMHDFWNVEEPAEKQQQMINFTKNVALAGAAVALMGVEEPWPASVSTPNRKTTRRLLRSVRRAAA